MRKKFVMLIAGTVLATANAPSSIAHEVAGVEITPTTTLPIKGVTESTDGNYNFKSFEVEAPETGTYFAEFWLLPTKYADNRYSKFTIYVNGNHLGDICPAVGNWQAARIDGHETVTLTEGTNVITIATPAPEFPEVETVNVALNDSDVAFSPDDYQAFLEDAAAGVTYDVPEAYVMAAYANTSTDVEPVTFKKVPLIYTFHKTFSFTKGQEIFVTTSSDAPHKIDFIYYGSDPIIPPLPPVGPLNNSQRAKSIDQTNSNSLAAVGGFTPPPPPEYDLIFPYTPATSEEMQGLSWVFPSEKASNSSKQVATGRIKITKGGQYLIRVHHAVNGRSSVADLNVNGLYYYEDMPISLSQRECVIPADGNYYATYTLCDNPGTDNPYLFIQGGACDKIVGFNDTGKSEKREQYGLSDWDSYISQKYMIKTKGVSVCSYKSSKPASYCDIYARVSEDATRSMSKARSKDSATAGIYAPSIKDETVQITVHANAGGTITITALENILKVSAYGLEGSCLGSIDCKEACVVIPASSLNMTQPGVYVLSIETCNGIVSKKVAVR